MAKRKKINEREGGKNDLTERLWGELAGLYYLSETDAEIVPFVGKKAEQVTREALLAQTGSAPDSPVEEKSFEEFFSRLTEIQDWHGEEEKQTAEKFSGLEKLLRGELKDLKVFKVGKVELDVYVVGLDARGRLMGVKTRAVET